MATFSMDLRERVARAKGTANSSEIAARFEVSASWVRKLWSRLRTTGSLEPGARGHRPRKVDEAGEGLLKAWIAAKPDLTIPEVMARYAAERGVEVSEPAMRRTLNRLGLSRKKRRSLRRSETAPKWLQPESTTSRAGSAGSSDV